jgi:hypothetical protein
MVFWIAILGAGLFVWLALRMGFYETWVLFFNVLISIYVSIYLTPVVARLAPAPEGAGSYMTALSMVVLAGACFAILHGLSFVFLTGQFSVPFPRVFDILLSGALGFVVGFLILSFVALIVTTTPLAQMDLVSTVGFSPESMHTNISCIAWWCDRVHSVAGFKADGWATTAAIGQLLEKPAHAESVSTTAPPDANKPPEPSHPKALPSRASLTKRAARSIDDGADSP